jgi:phosphoglycerate dehydrogenase-like enzyme
MRCAPARSCFGLTAAGRGGAALARIFICSDTGLNELLAGPAATFAAEGHEVIRGPMNDLGHIKHYTAEERAVLTDSAAVAVFTGRHHCSRELLENARLLRGVCSPVTGVESVDLDAAAELGIIVGHGSVRANVIGMAESTVMLMLMLFYDVQTNIRLINDGKWRRPGHNSRQIEGATIGLIGFGRIAREVVSRLAPFNVRIVTASPSARQQDLPNGVVKLELDELLAQSDLVSVLTGLSASTRHLLKARQLALMKPSAYLVNTARGEVIDEQALYETLRDRRIAGAALDTFPVEPLPRDSPLRRLDNVILTPHCVGHTIESWAELGSALVENVHRILAGELPLFCKNPDVAPAWRNRLRRLDIH